MVGSATSKAHTVILEPDLLKNGLKCVSVKLSEVLERDKRLDASFFDIEGKKARQAINDCPYPKAPLFGQNGFAKKVYHFPRFRRIFVRNGIPIYTASQILDTTPKPNKFISPKTKAKLDALRLKEGQIVMTCSGSIGFCSIVSRTLKDKLFSHDLIRINCESPYETGFVYAFLKTKFGHKVVSTNNYGSVVTHIEPDHLKTVIVPILPDNIRKQVHDNVMHAFSLRDEANDLEEQATELLYKHLKLPPIDSLKVKYLSENEELRAFSVNSSCWERRIDASFHIPLVDEILKTLGEGCSEITNIGDKRVSQKILLPGRFKRVYVDESYGTPFLSGGDILQYDPISVKYLSRKHSNRVKEELTIQENMVLVTRSGTVGKVLLAPKHFEGWTANEHVIRITPSEQINVGYMYAFLASDYGTELIKRFTYGSVVDEIDDVQLSSVEFPLPSKDIQDEIGNLVLEASRKRTQAYVLEKRSIEQIQQLIAHPTRVNS